jgi:hypothetical protein
VTSADRSFEGRLTDALTEPMTAAQRSSLDARLAPTLARPAPRHRFIRLPVRRSLLLVAALILLVPLVAATAAILSTEDPFGLADATEFQAELDAAKAAVPLPAGRTWPAHLTVTDQSAAYSRGGARSWVEGNAVCIWFDEWLDARAAGDATRAGLAAAEIARIPTWPSWNSPFWTQSVRDWYAPIIRQVANGDPSGVEAEMQNNCSWAAGD